MPSKYQRQKDFERNTNLIRTFCDEFGVELTELNNGYQLRLEGMLDLYPVRARWHNIKTGERGDWNGYKDLRRIMLEMIDKSSVVGEIPPDPDIKLRPPLQSFLQLPAGQEVLTALTYQPAHKEYPKWKFWRNKEVKYYIAVVTKSSRVYFVDPDAPTTDDITNKET